MGSAARKIAPLLFCSGFCALIYQIAWTREFRLIFGASTSASAAVLAIFIGGLGVGGVWLGKRADQASSPLVLYARLEGAVALATAATPALFWLVRKAYTGLGGTVALGLGGGTVVRLLLSVLVLAVPTVAMGGTLPAAARAAGSDQDAGRRSVALLYGINTIGAVLGCILSNFFLLEIFGSKLTLWIACLLNLLVALAALRVERELPDEAGGPQGEGSRGDSAEGEEQASQAPPWFVLASAALVGFVFFLMELVWYRMLGPILGGTLFTFGLILAVALLGIGLGGLYYALLGERRAPSLLSFANTCLLEAFFIALPFALGDRIALLSASLVAMPGVGFWGRVAGWFLIAGLVIGPAAFVSGVQFPMLIALLGRGRSEVGRQVGLTYGWNTAGAVLGSLAGGFGLMPLLGATGCWRLVALVLAALGAGAIGLRVASGRRGAAVLLPSSLLVAVLGLQIAEGPSAVWRHGGIGAGRFPSAALASPEEIENKRNGLRRVVRWEQDGVESSVAQSAVNSYSFIVNGKSDGNAIGDAGTQIMAGVVGSVLNPGASTAAVIGLGTGSTAGWLAAIPALKRVDVFEIEPLIRRVAADCAPINQDALNNPKLRLQIADAREVLVVSPQRYDIIFSEPSNPYRAGIASLFTQDFYRAIEAKMSPDGVFLQWVQGYEIDTDTLLTVYSTLGSVFPVIETWVLDAGDLMLVASRDRKPIDVARSRELLRQEPYRKAMAIAWHSEGLEGLLAHYLAGPDIAEDLKKSASLRVNTDDLNFIEFGFARSVGKSRTDPIETLSEAARRRRSGPLLANGAVDPERLADETISRRLLQKRPLPQPETLDGALRKRTTAMQQNQANSHKSAVKSWRAQDRQPTLTQRFLLAESLAYSGDDEALVHASELASYLPNEATYIRAALASDKGDIPETARLLEQLFLDLRQDPWLWFGKQEVSFRMAEVVNSASPALGARLLAAASQPFAVRAFEEQRHLLVFNLAFGQPDPQRCAEALRPYERFPIFEGDFLKRRVACYNEAKHPLAPRAQQDYLDLLDGQERSLLEILAPAAPQGRPAPPPPASSSP